MQKNQRVLGSLALATVLITAACAAPRMVPPADVSTISNAFEARDRSHSTGMLADESFELGAYHVDEVDRDATSKSGFSVGDYGNSETTTGYTYSLTSGPANVKGACGSLAKRKSVSMGGGSSADWGSTEITCRCTIGDAMSEIRLAGLQGANAGTVRLPEHGALTVTAVNETDKSNFSSTIPGFRVDSPNGPVGAVETLYPGKVWIERETTGTDADHLACLFVGLMLYVPPSDH